MARRREIDWDWEGEIERIERAVMRARAPRHRRVSLPPRIVAAIKRDADREYRRWFRDMDKAIGRLIHLQEQQHRSRDHATAGPSAAEQRRRGDR